MPQFRRTPKREIPLILSAGRIYEIFELGRDGRPRNLNTRDTTVTQVPIKDSGGVTHMVTAISANAGPEAGTPVDRKTVRDLLTAKLSAIKKDQSYIDVAVYPDSYTEAEWVRDALIDLGFGYNLVLMEEGKPVPTSTGEYGEQ